MKFTEDVSDFIAKITGKDGFLKQLNCKFLKTNIFRYKSNLCIGVAPPLFWFSFFLGLVGCCGCCAIPCTFYLNRNLAVDGKNKNKVYDKMKILSKNTGRKIGRRLGWFLLCLIIFLLVFLKYKF